MSLAQYRLTKNTNKGLDKLLYRRDNYADGLEFDRLRHCDAKFVKDTSHTSLLPQLHKKKIYQKILDWNESWSNAQKKVLLCGLTKICTTSQLESIATSLEPLFHREPMQQRNTLRPLDGKMKRKKKKKPPLNTLEPQRRIEIAPKTTTSGLSDMTDMPEEDRKDKGKPESSASSPVPSAIYSSTEVNAEKQNVTKQISENKVPSVPSVPSGKKVGTLKQTSSSRQPVPSISIEPDSSIMDPKPKPKKSRRSKKKIALVFENLDNRVTSQHHNALVGHKLTALHPLARSIDSVHSQHRSQISSQVSISQYFKSPGSRIDLLSAKFSCAPSPPGLQHASVPVQRMFKSVNVFGEAAASDGMQFVQLDKQKLKSIFNEQLRQIWEWVHGWKTHERLEFVLMMIKVSTPSLLAYLAQCLFQRLEERVDIGWLSDDHLIKIFSYLSAKDISTCSEVCRRWYYVAADEELWQQKCRALGNAHGIPHAIDFIYELNQDEDDMDWRIAYSELENTIKEGKQLPVQENDKKEDEKPHQRKAPSSASTYMSDISKKKFKDMVDKGPGMKLGHKLAEESEKLKETYRKLLQNETTRTYAWRMAHGDQDMFAFDEASEKEDEPNEDVPGEAKTGSNLFVIRRATATTSPSRTLSKTGSLQKSPMTMDPFALDVDSVNTSNLTNSLYDAESIMIPDQQVEHALDVWHDPVQAKELLGKDPHSYLESWICLTCIESDNADNPKRGGIQSVRRVRKFNAHLDAVMSFAYDSRRFISGGLDRVIRIWDIRTARSVHKLTSHKGGIGCLLLNVNTLFSGSWDETIMIWDLRYFERLAVLYGHRGSITNLKLAHRNLLSTAHDGTVRIWCLKSYFCVRVLQLHTGPIMALVVDHIENTIITGSSDRTIKITSLHSRKTLHTLESKDPINALLLQAGLIISTNCSGKVTFWNKYDGQAEAMIKCHDKMINCLGFRGGCFYTASDDMTIKEWDLLTLTCLRSLVGCRGKVLQIQLEQKFMISTDSTGGIRIWDFYSSLLIADDRDDDEIIMVKQLHESELEKFLRGDKASSPEEKKEVVQEEDSDDVVEMAGNAEEAEKPTTGKSSKEPKSPHGTNSLLDKPSEDLSEVELRNIDKIEERSDSSLPAVDNET